MIVSRVVQHAHCRRAYLVMDIEVVNERIAASRSRAIVGNGDEYGIVEHTGVPSRASCCRHDDVNPTWLLIEASTEAARNVEADAVWMMVVVVE